MTSINTNIGAYFAQNNLRSANSDATASIGRLSSGNRIVKASDDVAGLSVGTILRTNVSTLRTALSNTNQASTLIQIADGALKDIGELLQRQKALAAQANSGSLTDTERAYLNQEFQALASQIDQTVAQTNFNGQKLLDGSININSKLRENNVAASAPTGQGTYGTRVLNAAPVGTIGGTADRNIVGRVVDVKATFLTATTASFQIVLESGATLTSAVADFNSAGAKTFTSAGGQTWALTTVASAVTTQAQADEYAANLLADLSDRRFLRAVAIEATQSDLNGTDFQAIAASAFQSTALSGLTGASFTLTSSKFGLGGVFPAFKGFEILSNGYEINGTTTNATSVIYRAKIGDRTYEATVTTNLTDLNAGGTVTLRDTEDSTESLAIAFGSTLAGAASVNTQFLASKVAGILNDAFGVGTTGGLEFQVGTASDDKIDINIQNISTSKLYVDDDGLQVELDISTAAGAQTASDVVENAIRAVTSVRADVGAIQSRFDYAAAGLESSIQNQDAARAEFLDADISEEATKFAQEQVKLQASISVLAQANQLPQNLLKLIG